MFWIEVVGRSSRTKVVATQESNSKLLWDRSETALVVTSHNPQGLSQSIGGYLQERCNILNLSIITLLHISLSREVVLGLGHVVSESHGLLPGIVAICSSLQVEFGVVLELAGLGNVLLVDGVLLGNLFVTDLLVLSSGQTSRDVRVRSNLGKFDLRWAMKRISTCVSKATISLTIADLTKHPMVRSQTVCFKMLFILTGFLLRAP
jgi:hypothetical protein